MNTQMREKRERQGRETTARKCTKREVKDKRDSMQDIEQYYEQ